MDFRPLSHESKQVGKIIKVSKRKDAWVFELHGQTHTVEYFSSLRGNRKLFIDGQMYPAEINQKQIRECSFRLDGESFSITNGVAGATLYINDLSFDDAYGARYQGRSVSPCKGKWERPRHEKSDSWGSADQHARQEEKTEPFIFAPGPKLLPKKAAVKTKPEPQTQEIDLLSFEPVKPLVPLASLDVNKRRAAQPQVYYPVVRQSAYQMNSSYVQAWRPNPY